MTLKNRKTGIKASDEVKAFITFTELENSEF